MSSNSISTSVDAPGQNSRLETPLLPLLGRPAQVLRQSVPIGGYSVAVVSVLLAFLLRLLVDPWLGDQSPYLLFVVAVAVTGLYAGVRPALLAGGLGTMVAYFCFVPPRYEWGLAGVSEAVGFGVYMLGVAGVILLTHARTRAAETSERHRMEAEQILLKTERLSAAGQMASLLAHEINNPLAALTNVMFLLNQEALSPTPRDLLAGGTDALHRLNRIAGMTLAFYFEKDAPALLRICDIVDEVAQTMTSAERFKNIQCFRDFRAEPRIVASPVKMKQLLASLLTNAMESGAKTVKVRVDWAPRWRSPRCDGVRITIADDGCGIPRELREKIFEPFFSSKPERGTGLGLWASRAIVLRNEGRINIRSAIAGPRKGTSVSVFLPTNVAARRFFSLDVRQAAGTPTDSPLTGR